MKLIITIEKVTKEKWTSTDGMERERDDEKKVYEQTVEVIEELGKEIIKQITIIANQ